MDWTIKNIFIAACFAFGIVIASLALIGNLMIMFGAV